jgi:hypothetical protein
VAQRRPTGGAVHAGGSREAQERGQSQQHPIMSSVTRPAAPASRLHRAQKVPSDLPGFRCTFTFGFRLPHQGFRLSPSASTYLLRSTLGSIPRDTCYYITPARNLSNCVRRSICDTSPRLLTRVSMGPVTTPGRTLGTSSDPLGFAQELYNVGDLQYLDLSR